MNYLTNFVSNHEAFFDSFEQNIHGVDSKLRKKAKLEAYKFRRDLVKEFISEHQLPLGELADAFEGSEITEKQKDRLAKALYLVIDDVQDPISAEQKTVIGNFLHANQIAKKSIEGIKGQRLESDLLNLSSRVVTSHGLNNACTKIGEINELADKQSIYFGFDDAFFVKKASTKVVDKHQDPSVSLDSTLDSKNDDDQQPSEKFIKSAKIDKSEIIDHISEHVSKVGLSHVNDEVLWLSEQIGDDITQGEFLALIERRKRQLESGKDAIKQQIESNSKLSLEQLKSKLSVIAASFSDDEIKKIIEKAGIDIPSIDEDSENVDMVVIAEGQVIEPNTSQFGVIRDADKLSEIVLESHRDYASEAQRIMIENGFIFEKHVNRFEKFIKPTAKYDDDALIRTMLDDPDWSEADAEREESRLQREEKRQRAKEADAYNNNGKGLADRLKGTFDSANDWLQDKGDERHDKRNRDRLTSQTTKRSLGARVVAREIIRSDKSVIKDKSGNEVLKLSSGRSMLDVISGRTGNYARAAFTRKGFLNPEVHKISALKLKEAGVKKPLITLPTHSSVSESDKKEFLRSTYKSLREAGYEPDDIAYSTGMILDKALRQELDKIRKEVDLEIAQKVARDNIKFGAMIDSDASEATLKPDGKSSAPDGDKPDPTNSTLLATGSNLNQTIATGHKLEPSSTSGGKEPSPVSQDASTGANVDLDDANVINRENAIDLDDMPEDLHLDGEDALQAELDEKAMQAELDEKAIQAELDEKAIQAELDEKALNIKEQRSQVERQKTPNDEMVDDVNFADKTNVDKETCNSPASLGDEIGDSDDLINKSFSANDETLKSASEMTSAQTRSNVASINTMRNITSPRPR